MSREYIITVLDCSQSEIFTAEYGLEAYSYDNARKEFMRLLSKDCPYHRYIILSIYDKETVIVKYKEGIPLPKEVQRYFEGELPVDGKNNCEDINWRDAYLNSGIDPDRPTPNFDENDDDFEDGDEWKRLLN